MKVGDLVYYEHYAFGVVIEVQRTGCVVRFTGRGDNRKAWFDKRQWPTLERLK